MQEGNISRHLTQIFQYRWSYAETWCLHELYMICMNNELYLWLQLISNTCTPAGWQSHNQQWNKRVLRDNVIWE